MQIILPHQKNWQNHTFYSFYSITVNIDRLCEFINESAKYNSPSLNILNLDFYTDIYGQKHVNERPNRYIQARKTDTELILGIYNKFCQYGDRNSTQCAEFFEIPLVEIQEYQSILKSISNLYAEIQKLPQLENPETVSYEIPIFPHNEPKLTIRKLEKLPWDCAVLSNYQFRYYHKGSQTNPNISFLHSLSIEDADDDCMYLVRSSDLQSYYSCKKKSFKMLQSATVIQRFSEEYIEAWKIALIGTPVDSFAEGCKILDDRYNTAMKLLKE